MVCFISKHNDGNKRSQCIYQFNIDISLNFFSSIQYHLYQKQKSSNYINHGDKYFEASSTFHILQWNFLFWIKTISCIYFYEWTFKYSFRVTNKNSNIYCHSLNVMYITKIMFGNAVKTVSLKYLKTFLSLKKIIFFYVFRSFFFCWIKKTM